MRIKVGTLSWGGSCVSDYPSVGDNHNIFLKGPKIHLQLLPKPRQGQKSRSHLSSICRGDQLEYYVFTMTHAQVIAASDMRTTNAASRIVQTQLVTLNLIVFARKLVASNFSRTVDDLRGHSELCSSSLLDGESTRYDKLCNTKILAETRPPFFHLLIRS